MKIRNAIPILMAIVLGTALSLAALTASAQEQPATTTTPFVGIRFVPDEAGVRVTEVRSGSPAEDAGLQVDDVITEVDGSAVDAASFVETIRSRTVGDSVTLTVMRGAETLEITVTLAQTPDNLLPPQRPFLGFGLEETADGLVISNVSEGTPAAEAGLQSGDVLLAIGDTEVSTIQEARTAVRGLEPGATVVLQISRDGQEQSITVTVGTIADVRSEDRFNEFSYDVQNQTWTIGRISENSPLYAAGLREGDVISAFNGETYDLPGLMQFIMGLAPDAAVTLTVQRGDETLSIDVPATTLQRMALSPMQGGRPRDSDGRPGNSPRDGMPFIGGARLGVMFLTLDEQVASANNVTVTDGALITQVEEGSPAAEAGLQTGDIVTAVDGDSVDFEHTLRDRLFAYEPGDVVTLDVLRDGETLQIQVTLGQPQMNESLPFEFFGDPGTQQPVTPPLPADAPAA